MVAPAAWIGTSNGGGVIWASRLLLVCLVLCYQPRAGAYLSSWLVSQTSLRGRFGAAFSFKMDLPNDHTHAVPLARTPAEALIYTLKLCSSPAALMLLGSFSVFCRQPSVTFVQMTQHLGAGIVLSAVATELLPAMSAQAKTHWASSAVATLIGFFLGVIMMVSVETFCSAEEGDEEDEDKDPPTGSPVKHYRKAISRAQSSMSEAVELDSASPPHAGAHRRRSMVENLRRSSTSHCDTGLEAGQAHSHGAACLPSSSIQSGKGVEMGGQQQQLVAAKETTSLLGGAHAKVSVRKPVDVTPITSPAGLWAIRGIPWTLVVAVYVDSFMDGLLIGISAVAGQNAGLIMTVALTIEMMFLGLTFSASLQTLSNVALRYLLVTGAPLMILVGGAVGAWAAALLSANPIMQIGLIAFGVAALLYLVTEELLIEAHENGEGHVWYVDMCFFAGFIISVLLEQAVDSRSG